MISLILAAVSPGLTSTVQAGAAVINAKAVAETEAPPIASAPTPIPTPPPPSDVGLLTPVATLPPSVGPELPVAPQMPGPGVASVAVASIVGLHRYTHPTHTHTHT